jgi:hypothetical protein
MAIVFQINHAGKPITFSRRIIIAVSNHNENDNLSDALTYKYSIIGIDKPSRW